VCCATTIQYGTCCSPASCQSCGFRYGHPWSLIYALSAQAALQAGSIKFLPIRCLLYSRAVSTVFFEEYDVLPTVYTTAR
jgi:hypothetical protein